MIVKLATMLKLGKSSGSLGRYRLVLLTFWIYCAAWIAAFLGIGFSSLRLSFKIPLGVLLALLTPDLDSLFMSYNKYLEHLNKHKY